ncbi:MAG: hypothetical protein L0211_08485, partial [Planctomycetaceae bacterium]|nr:hypothetical protein [Planctomycetaceae bacterium]
MAHESQSFDAYYKWLGIPPEEQPPDHYRLLAIKPFEADLDVIESAADQRMAHLRGRQTGKNSALSQKLLNEIAAAKVDLLHPEKKREYDARLRQSLAAREPKVARAIALPEQPSIQVERKPGLVAVARPSAPRRASGWIVGVGIGVGLVIVGAIAVFLFLSRPGSEIAKTSPAPASKLPDKQVPTAVVPPVNSADPADDAPAPVPTTAPDQPPAPTLPTPDAPTEAANTPVPQDLPRVEPPAPENSLAAAQPTLDARSPVPDVTALDKARQTVKEIYAEKFAAAKLPEQKSALAATIFKQGLDTTNDPAGQYVLLDTARRMAEQAGDLELSLKVCKHLADSFAVEVFPLQQSALDACGKLARKQADWQTIAGASLTLLDAAIAANDYAAAEQFAATALASARKARNKDLIARATQRAKEVATLAAAYATAQGAFAKLKTDPDDAVSHLAAGKFLCFVKGDWPAGLVHLAKGSDESLA